MLVVLPQNCYFSGIYIADNLIMKMVYASKLLAANEIMSKIAFNKANIAINQFLITFKLNSNHKSHINVTVCATR